MVKILLFKFVIKGYLIVYISNQYSKNIQYTRLIERIEF